MAKTTTNASTLLDEWIRELGDWRGQTLSKGARTHQGRGPRYRRRVEVGETHEPPEPRSGPITGVSVLGELYKHAVKLPILQGGCVARSSGRFNAGLDGQVRRAIDITEHDTIDEGALTNLIREAVAAASSRARTSPREQWSAGHANPDTETHARTQGKRVERVGGVRSPRCVCARDWGWAGCGAGHP